MLPKEFKFGTREITINPHLQVQTINNYIRHNEVIFLPCFPKERKAELFPHNS
jgi:hypothetical protein